MSKAVYTLKAVNKKTRKVEYFTNADTDKIIADRDKFIEKKLAEGETWIYASFSIDCGI